MRHVNDGALRRMIDHSPAVSDRDRAHVAACAHCRERVAAIQNDMLAAESVLALPELSSRSGPALATFHARHTSVAPHAARSRWAPRLRLPRPVGAALGAAALVGALALTPAGSLAANFITVFQPTQVTALSVTSSDIRALAQLRQYGTLSVPTRIPQETAGSAADASAKSGLTVLVPGPLPAGIPTTARYSIQHSATGTFTFSASKAAAAARAAGTSLPPMPQKIDGSTLQITTGTGVLSIFGTSTDGLPALIIGQMRAPVVRSSGVSVTSLENYVLGLPGVSKQLAAEVRAIGDPSSTLPIPVPVNLAQAHDVTVNGIRGLAIGDQTGLGSVVVWQQDGMIFAVGGALPESQVLSIANSLHA